MHIPAMRLLPALGGSVSLCRKLNLVPCSYTILSFASNVLLGIALSLGRTSEAFCTFAQQIALTVQLRAELLHSQQAQCH